MIAGVCYGSDRIGCLRARNWVTYDCNGDGGLDISDPLCNLGWLFRGQSEPPCLQALDFNGDNGHDITDPVSALRFLFRGERSPSAGVGSQGYPTCLQSDGASDHQRAVRSYVL